MISLGIDQSTTSTKGIDEMQINCLIIQPNIDRSLISDGTHTFGELYKTISDYRKALKQIEQFSDVGNDFLAICQMKGIAEEALSK